METLEQILAESPFLQGLQPHHLELLTGCASNVRFEGGQYLFHEGEEAEQFFLIRHGRIAIELFAPDRGARCTGTRCRGNRRRTPKACRTTRTRGRAW